MADGTGDDPRQGAILQLAVINKRLGDWLRVSPTAEEIRELRFQLEAITRALETLVELRAPAEGPDAEVHELRPRLRPEGDDCG